MAASDIGLITKVFVEMYNTGQSKKWFLEKVRHKMSDVELFTRNEARGTIVLQISF